MKKIIITLMLISIAAISFSQQPNSAKALTRQDYLKKSKTQKTVGWCLLGGGGIVFLAGISKNLDAADGNPGGGEGSVIAGSAMGIGGITFLVLSGKNKKKAVSMSFKNQQLPLLQHNGLAYKYIPSINFKLFL